jgi:lysophospholipase L1-like esterase
MKGIVFISKFGKILFVVTLLIMLFGDIYGQDYSESADLLNQYSLQPTDNVKWHEFATKFNSISQSNTQKITILHIGDSHIQGGIFSNHLRDLFTGINLKAGRGMTFPYNLTKTYGPADIKFFTNTKWTAIKCSRNNPFKTGIAGYELNSRDSVMDITIKTNCPNYCNKIKIYHNAVSFNTECNLQMQTALHTINDSIFFTEYSFKDYVDSVRFIFKRTDRKPTNFQLFMVNLENTSDDFVYNSLGVNGITFDRYLREIDYLTWVKHIHPDCIIISMGTNDAFPGNIAPMKFRNSVNNLISDISRVMPNSPIIITSPNDHLRNQKILNNSIPITRDILKDVARENGCLFWDFYEIMGGIGSSRDWYSKGWMHKDMVHLSKEGYKQQARLFFNSFINALGKTEITLKD